MKHSTKILMEKGAMSGNKRNQGNRGNHRVGSKDGVSNLIRGLIVVLVFIVVIVGGFWAITNAPDSSKQQQVTTKHG